MDCNRPLSLDHDRDVTIDVSHMRQVLLIGVFIVLVAGASWHLGRTHREVAPVNAETVGAPPQGVSVTEDTPEWVPVADVPSVVLQDHSPAEHDHLSVESSPQEVATSLRFLSLTGFYYTLGDKRRAGLQNHPDALSFTSPTGNTLKGYAGCWATTAQFWLSSRDIHEALENEPEARNAHAHIRRLETASRLALAFGHFQEAIAYANELKASLKELKAAQAVVHERAAASIVREALYHQKRRTPESRAESIADSLRSTLNAFGVNVPAAVSPRGVFDGAATEDLHAVCVGLVNQNGRWSPLAIDVLLYLIEERGITKPVARLQEMIYMAIQTERIYRNERAIPIYVLIHQAFSMPQHPSKADWHDHFNAMESSIYLSHVVDGNYKVQQHVELYPLLRDIAERSLAMARDPRTEKHFGATWKHRHMALRALWRINKAFGHAQANIPSWTNAMEQMPLEQHGMIARIEFALYEHLVTKNYAEACRHYSVIATGQHGRYNIERGLYGLCHLADDTGQQHYREVARQLATSALTHEKNDRHSAAIERYIEDEPRNGAQR